MDKEKDRKWLRYEIGNTVEKINNMQKKKRERDGSGAKMVKKLKQKLSKIS